RRDEELQYTARPNLRIRGVSWPLFALFGGLGTGAAWIVVVIQYAPARWSGLAWLAVGFVVYAVYRKRFLRVDLTHTTRAPVIVREATDRNAELIVLGAPRRGGRRGAPIFGRTVDYVLRASPCRVLVAAGRTAA